MTIQERNAELVALLRPDFQGRAEPNFAWTSACSSMLALPGLRGFWPMSVMTDAAQAIDLSANGLTMTYAGSPVYGYEGLIPYCDFDGTGDYLWRADGADVDIDGLETYIQTDIRGLTAMSWVYPTSLPQVTHIGIMGKYRADTNQRSWMCDIASNTSPPRFYISSTGANSSGVTSTINLVQDTWQFIACRFHPLGTNDKAIFVGNADGITLTEGNATYANLFNCSSQLRLGGVRNISAAVRYFPGSMSLIGLCATALPDYMIQSVFEQTRALFGV